MSATTATTAAERSGRTTTEHSVPPGGGQPPSAPVRRRGKGAGGSTLLAHGEPLVWLTGGALVLCLAMIVGLLGLVVHQGLGSFRVLPVEALATVDGARLLGEITRREHYTPEPDGAGGASSAAADAANARGRLARGLVRIGNFELTGEHYRWVDEHEIAARELPPWALVVERTAWGRFYGLLDAFVVDGQDAASTPDAAWQMYRQRRGEVAARQRERRRLETRDVGRVNHALEQARLRVRAAELRAGDGSPAHAEAVTRYAEAQRRADVEFARLRGEIERLNAENARLALRLITADGATKLLPLGDIVRAYPANRLDAGGNARVYLARAWEFLSREPREANSEGGVFPAIFGTVTMTLLMSILVVPFGVLAALYLREYAKSGPIVSAVRIAINNLAGVPSIVFGVFGLGFFCYIIGGGLDRWLFAAKLPTPTYGTGGVFWASLTLALLTLPVVIVATEEALAAVPSSMREGSYACGASKWQTIRRIVLPRALPGIMTGMILAMARGAGEVAPLMLVGAVKLAPELPVDGVWPYLHPERSFMHLGFHIFDLGFQSQNSEAAKPMVFTTTLLLIAIIFILNVTAVRLRTRLRKKFLVSQF